MTPAHTPAPIRELVLVGAGHAHIQVLRAFAMDRPPARVTLVVDRPISVYSGMVPGCIAGHYDRDELEIDALPLARLAGARILFAAATGIDVREKRIALEGRASLPYDLASFDIGSTTTGLHLPGVVEHAIASRPIGRFVDQIAQIDAAVRARGGRPFHVVVVGGGSGGIEVAATLDARLRSLGAVPGITLVHAEERLLPGYPARVAGRIAAILARRRIETRTARMALRAEPGMLVLDDERLPFDALLWMTGAAPHPLFRESGLALDARGFLQVRDTLQLVGEDRVFAAGDCATPASRPDLPKAGVHAVRQGPVLTRNLRAALAGGALEPYRPQKDFLTLLALGEGNAFGTRNGFAAEGHWVMRWKDRIDRRFMRRFRLLDRAGDDGPAMAMLPPMPAMNIVCGGCAAKLGQTALERALERLPRQASAPEVLLGVDAGDDVAAIRLPAGDTLVVSVDFFRGFTDDPWLVGRIAAENALSDLDAKGIEPRWAQALVSIPLAEDEKAGEETLYQVLAGARTVFDTRGVRLVGGHTSRATELQVGFSVQGVQAAGRTLARRRGILALGDQLILTRPLGTGVLFHADMAGRARGPWIEAALESMLRGNHRAAPIAARANAATDVTGFGFAGHLASMLSGSGLSARISLDAIPVLEGAIELLRRGVRSSFHDENAKARKAMAIDESASREPRLELLFDPQTAGGLILVFAAKTAEAAVKELRDAGYSEAAVIGRISAGREDGAFAEVVRSLY